VASAALDRHPAAIALPTSAAEVAQVILFARESGLELAIRSGGHSTAGHSTSEGGIVLDLARLKRLDVHPAACTAWAETGLTAGEVTDAAAAHGLAIGFGDTASVGIGGLTLGGGVGYLARKHGLTIDNLPAAEVVGADGRLLRADAETRPDLFWALRGGGGNFGVATRFLHRLHPLEAVTGGLLVLAATPELLADFLAAADTAPEAITTIVNVMPAPPLPFLPKERHGELVVLATVVYAGTGPAADRALAPFRALAEPIVDLIRPQPYAQLFPREEGGPELRAAMRSFFMDGVDVAAAGSILNRLRESTAPMRAVQLRVLGGAITQVPAHATAYAHRRNPIMAGVVALYADPTEASEHERWTEDTAASLRGDDDRVYVNFLGDEGPGRVRAAYPGTTWQRLVAVKRRHDPDNLFRLDHNVPPHEFG
jgi:FAD/FMN-containing dehydrogenase